MGYRFDARKHIEPVPPASRKDVVVLCSACGRAAIVPEHHAVTPLECVVPNCPGTYEAG
jgi:hypothetical protein